MMSYAKQKQDKISSDLKDITEYILHKEPDIYAIFLVGSFGRNEGSVLDLDGRLIIINDYDFILISEKKRSQNTINLLRRELESHTKIRQIDISFYTKKELKKLKFTMYSYDLKYASKLLWGNKECLNLVPKMNAQDMPLIEAVRPLLLFPVSLLQAYPKEKMSAADLFWSYQQITKSIFGWASALLILRNKYNPSYKKRYIIFREIYKDFPELCLLLEQAISFKLDPVFDPIDIENYYDFWKKCSSVHIDVLIKVLQIYLPTKSHKIENILARYKKTPINIIKALLSLLPGIDKRTIINFEVGQTLLCKSLIFEENTLEKMKYKRLAIREASRIPYFKKYNFSKNNKLNISDQELINFFISNNPNSESWHRKGNKLTY